MGEGMKNSAERQRERERERDRENEREREVGDRQNFEWLLDFVLVTFTLQFACICLKLHV